MQSNIPTKYSLFVARSIAMTFIFLLSPFLAFGQTTHDVPISSLIESMQNITFGENVSLSAFTNPVNISDVDVGLPIRIQIPKINIDTAIESAGLTPEGALDVPIYHLNAAWFNQNPRPGQIGVSIIDGHSGWKNGIQAVFDNLHTLHKGDKIYITDEKGKTTIFMIRMMKIYKEGDDTSDVFESTDSHAHLNLITCIGVWNEHTKTSSERLVVFTDKVG